MIRVAIPSRLRLVLGTVFVLTLTGCDGPAGDYAGTWTRDLTGEGEVRMNLASNGTMELMLPSPRWPEDVDMVARAAFTGDTLVFRADTTVAPCQTDDARYVINRDADQLRIAGVGMDSCGGRRAALVGTWERG